MYSCYWTTCINYFTYFADKTMLQCLSGSSCVRVIEGYKSTWYFLVLVLAYVVYLIFGALVFSAVELPYEEELRRELRTVKQQFLEDNECLSDERLEEFLARALEASNYGVSVLNNATTNWNWDFTSALFFASTVLSTTGEHKHSLDNTNSLCLIGFFLYSNPADLYIYI